jgi:hypothetical protein
MALGFPIINGNRFDFSSVELKINGKRYIGVKELSYKHSLEEGEVRGTAPQVLGRTRGLYKAEGSITLFREEFDDLSSDLQVLAVGLFEANFLITAIYSELPPNGVPSGMVGDTQTDELIGSRFKSAEMKGSGGSSDPLVVQLDLSILYIKQNGLPPLNNLIQMANAI